MMKQRKMIIGIDPGKNGGVATMWSDGNLNEVISMPETPKDILDYLRIYSESNAVAYLEDVGHGMPSQSSSATAKFARHNGHLEMALLALGIKTVKVTPQKWERTYQLGKSSDFKKADWKRKLKAKAQELFPKVKVTLVNSDALLIAEYGRRQELRK